MLNQLLKDIALDIEGFHLDGGHSFKVSPATQDTQYPIASGSGSLPLNPSRSPELFAGQDDTSELPSATLSKHKSISLLQLPQHGVLRATSEPLLDLDKQQEQESALGLPVQEYSWEWGGFPQPSPMKLSFGVGRFDSVKGKGKVRMDPLDSTNDLHPDSKDEEPFDASFRSRSVPPELDGSPTLARNELPDENVTESPTVNIPSRGLSPTPLSNEEPLSGSDEREPPHRPDPDATRKPTSSSWSRWWSRTRNNKDAEGSKKTNRPNIREIASSIVSEINFFVFVCFLTLKSRPSHKGANQR